MKKAWLGAALLGCLSFGCGREELKMQSKVPSTATPDDNAAVASAAPTTPEGPPPPTKVGPITDTHIHLFTLPRSQPPMSDNGTFPGSSPSWLSMTSMVPDYESSAGGAWVDSMVVIEAVVGVPPSKMISANQWMLDQVQAEPKLLSVVGGLDVLQAPAAFKTQLDALAVDKHFVGLRIGGGDLITRGQIKANALANLTELGARGMMVDTLDTSGTQVAQLAKAVPTLRFVIDHLAQKSYDFDVPNDWKANLAAAAAQPNVYLKLSDIGRLNQGNRKDGWSTPYPSSADPADYAPVFEAAWSAFGEDRLMFGSNWPVSKVAGDFQTQILVLEAFLKDKGEEARNKVMNDNALKIYGPRP